MEHQTRSKSDITINPLLSLQEEQLLTKTSTPNVPQKKLE